MAATQGTPTDSDIYLLVMDRLMRGLAVAQVGRVESYNASKQVADIKPMVLRLVPSGQEDQVAVAEERPVIPSVRVLHYRCGGFYIHAPPAAGDSVLLVVLDQDPTNWIRTGQVARPADRRMHHLAHAVAIPGLFPSTKELAGLGDNLQLGKEGGITVEITSTTMEVDGNSDAAARASRVDTQLNDLKTAINGWTPVAMDGGAALKAALSTWLGQSADTGSDKLKVGG